MNKRYQLTYLAVQDIANIRDYLSPLNPSAADQLIEEFFEKFALLAERPLIGHQREDLTDRSYRFWSVGRYLIVYDPETTPLGIIRVLSAYRDITPLL